MGIFRIQYGYQKSKSSFLVASDFFRQGYRYSEKQEDFVFKRYWGPLTCHSDATHVFYKNLSYRGIVNRYDYWGFYISQKERTIYIEKKKERLYYYDTHCEKSLGEQECYVELVGKGDLHNNTFVENSTSKEGDSIKEERLSSLVAEMIKKHEGLYNQIGNKEHFFQEMKEYYSDFIDDLSTEEDFEEYIIESERQFLNFIDSEKLFLNLNEDEILDKFSYAVNELGREEIKAVLSYNKGARIDEFTKETLLYDMKEEIDYLIQRRKFEKKLEIYDLEYLLNKYQSEVDKVSDREDFIKELKSEVDNLKFFVLTEESFFSKIEQMIFQYTQKDAFVSKYGNDDISIELSEEREALFNNLTPNEISEKDLREYELYHELEKTRSVEMYCKDGKTLKPSFRAIPTFISNFKKIIKTAIDCNLIQWNGEEYEFVSIDNLQKFGRKAQEELLSKS